MHGNTRYQANQLISTIDCRGQSKYEAKQAFYALPGIKHTTQEFARTHGLYSHANVDKVRGVARACFDFAHSACKRKDITKLTANDIKAWLTAKVEDGIAAKTAADYKSTVGKLGLAITTYLNDKTDRYSEYQTAADEVFRSAEFLQTKQREAYKNMNNIINNIKDDRYRLAAKIYYATGCRASEGSLIRPKQLNGEQFSYISKGGQSMFKTLPTELTAAIIDYIAKDGVYEIDQDVMRRHLRKAATAAGEKYEGIHGIRYTYAVESYRNHILSGLSHEDVLLAVSHELGHHRPEITLHYLRGGRSGQF
jgi:integrase